jgi:cytidylate kinase
MNKYEKFVITINRELGSGGRTIGEKLSKKLNVPFYDKALIQQLKEQYHLTVEQIEFLKGQKHNWWADCKRSMMMMPNYVGPSYIGTPVNMPDFLITDEIFQTETEILKGIAEDGSCIIAGRSGFHIFRDHPNALKIFIHADDDCRKQRIGRKYDISESDAAAMIVDNDYSRELYTKTYTGSDWQDARNYDIALNVRNFGVNGAVDFLMTCLSPLS